MSEPVLPPEQGPSVRIEVELPAVEESVDRFAEVLADLWERQPGIGDGDRMRVETAAVEILGNIVEHAFRHDGDSDPRRQIDIVLIADADEVLVVLADDGVPNGLDLSAVTMPDAEAESGRGLPLATAVLDDLTYERVGERNRWTLTCRRRD